jgi:hypothetical protein
MRTFSQLNQHPALGRQRFPERLWPRRSDPEGVEEGRIFLYFAESAHLSLDSAPTKLKPPMPDLECAIAGERRLFEVGEILATDLAKGADRSAKRARKKMEAISNGDMEAAASIQTWGYFEAERYASLDRILRKKLANKYKTAGAPTHLLLFYDQQSPQGPPEEPIDYFLQRHQEWANLIAGSVFQRVWIFHLAKEFVIGYLEVAPDGTLAAFSRTASG